MMLKLKLLRKLMFGIGFLILILGVYIFILYKSEVESTKIDKKAIYVSNNSSYRINLEKKTRTKVLKDYENKIRKDKIGVMKEKINRRLNYMVEKSSKRIPILMYHRVDNSEDNEIVLSKEVFKKQMDYLKDNNFTTINFDELYSYFLDDSSLPNKPVILTFDDGYEDNYQNAYPILKEHGFKATVFMITSEIDKNKFMNVSQIKELDKNNIRIESHTVSHPRLNTLSIDEQINELKNSRDSLQKVLGREVKYIAYPYGEYNEDTLAALDKVGYNMAVTTFYGKAKKMDGFYNLHRFPINSKDQFTHFEKVLNYKYD